MVFDIPFNALLICYGPLFLTVTGFIFFALLSDFDARRPYLRTVIGGEQPLGTAIIAQTPSGAEVLIRPASVQPDVIEDVEPAPELPASSDSVEEAAAGEVVEEEASVDEDVVEAAAEVVEGETQDDLRMIVGIGPKTEEALNSAGINTYAKMASMSADELMTIIKDAGVRLVGDTSAWPQQAQFLADGDMDGLRDFQANLGGGD